jgi:hypothetical protein
MAKVNTSKSVHTPIVKRTSIGKGKLKTSSMNKHKRRNKGMSHNG